MRNRNPWDDPIPTYEPREPLVKRVGRFLLLIGGLFAIATAVLVTQRLSRDSLALLIGLTCGIAAMLPTIALGVLVWRREDARRSAREEAQTQQRSQPYATPPVIVVSPQALPGNGYGQHPALGQSGQANAWAPAAGQRDFKIVGGND